jgi:hypothetical protein
MSSFPTSLPAAGTASATATLAAAGHTALHNNHSDEIRALATKVGTGSATSTSGTVLRGNGAGTSTWGQVALTTDVTGTLPVANGGTGTTSTTGSGSVVFGTAPTISGASLTGSPTITTPTIASFVNANHDHSNSAGGGSLGNTTATSLTTNTIGANGANHLALSAGTSKLVKLTVLRQDDTSNTYQSGNTVMLTGWGVMAITTATPNFAETVTFGVTFTQAPIVTITCGGDALTASGSAYGTGGFNIASWAMQASALTASSFSAKASTSTGANPGANGFVWYQWTAIGEI